MDSQTGLVLQSGRKKESLSLEEAFAREQARKEKSDEMFQKVFLDEKKRQSSLEEKFKEALKSKDELDEPPPRPWDLD
ncbi:MAG TPA: hypothetical protein VKZ59_01485 [Acidobacteriota bacterium]|nr:hypothetical protein [Acidobacteriota bacterium]